MKTTFTLILLATLSHFTTFSAPNDHFFETAEFAQLRTNLYIVPPDKSNVLVDGTLTQYDIDYSNDVDGKDGRKMSNLSENFGMLRGNTVLIVERRKAIETRDSIFFKMWNMRTFNYQLEVESKNLNLYGKTAVLEDRYLAISTPLDLDGKTYINFSVNSDPASKAADRFRIVFSTPVFAFTSVKAICLNSAVNVNWQTANQNRVKEYLVEKSADGNHFEKAADVNTEDGANNNYKWVDANPADGMNYYRISSVGNNPGTGATEVVKVYVEKLKQGISIFPNPVVANNLNLQMVGQPAGRYEIRLVNYLGRTFMSKSIQHVEYNRVENISPSQNIPKGLYQLQIKTPAGEKKVISLVF